MTLFNCKTILFLPLVFSLVGCNVDNTSQVEDGTTEDELVEFSTHSFTFNNKNYELVKEPMVWIDAASYALSKGGYLAEINDEDEQNTLYLEIIENVNVTYNETNNSFGYASIWLGGNDLEMEGSWIWNGDNDDTHIQFWSGGVDGLPVNGLYNNWGNEPDNNGEQDALCMGIEQTPINEAGKWTDLDISTELFFIIEYPETETEADNTDVEDLTDTSSETVTSDVTDTSNTIIATDTVASTNTMIQSDSETQTQTQTQTQTETVTDTIVITETETETETENTTDTTEVTDTQTITDTSDVTETEIEEYPYHSFTYNNKNYEIIKEAMPWLDAASYAESKDGYLSEINDQSEQNALFLELLENVDISGNETNNPFGFAAIWLGANDLVEEGTWVWNGDNDETNTHFWTGEVDGTAINGLYNNWGREPDNNGDQDAMCMGIEATPINDAGKWTDLNKDTQLFFVIEYD